MTLSPECPSRALATASVVVPMLMNSDALSGMWLATSRAMRRFSSGCMILRAV